MGIFIHAVWKGQTKKESKRQRIGYAPIYGRFGSLAEVSQMRPYVTPSLFPEAFESKDDEAAIPASILRERLPEAFRLAELKYRRLFCPESEIEATLRNLRDFVELCERKEQETGEPVTIRVCD